MNDYSQLVQRYKELKQERDEAVAQVEVIRSHLSAVLDSPIDIGFARSAREALSSTPSAALKEIQARTLEEAANTDFVYGISERLRQLAAAKRKEE